MIEGSTAILTIAIASFYIYFQYRNKAPKREMEAPLYSNCYPFEATLQFGKDADKFLKQCTNRFGSTFAIYLGSEYTVFVNDERDHSSVTKCKELSFDPAMQMFEERAQLSSKEGISIAYKADNLKKDHSHIRSIQNSVTVEAFLANGISILNDRFEELPKQNGDIDLYSWINDVVFETATRVVYGSRFYTPDMKPDFDEWSGNFALLMAGFPSYFFPKTVKSMNRLTQYFADALESHSFADASDFVKNRVQSKRESGLSLIDQAKSNLGILLAANSNLIPCTFWVFYYLLHPNQAEVLKSVRLELATNLDLTNPSTWKKESLEKCILLNSCILETVRLTSGSFPLRIALQDTTLELPSGPISLLKGDQVMLVGSARWKHEKGNLFVADRFLNKQPNMPLFGFGSHMCTGRIFAINFIKTFVAKTILLGNPQLSFDAEPVKDMSKVGQGIYPPVGTVKIRWG